MIVVRDLCTIMITVNIKAENLNRKLSTMFAVSDSSSPNHADVDVGRGLGEILVGRGLVGSGREGSGRSFRPMTTRCASFRAVTRRCVLPKELYPLRIAAVIQVVDKC